MFCIYMSYETSSIILQHSQLHLFYSFTRITFEMVAAGEEEMSLSIIFCLLNVRIVTAVLNCWQNTMVMYFVKCTPAFFSLPPELFTDEIVGCVTHFVLCERAFSYQIKNQSHSRLLWTLCFALCCKCQIDN